MGLQGRKELGEFERDETMNIYFKNESTGRTYKVLEFDQEKGEVCLQGTYSPRGFVIKYDKEVFRKNGYTLIQEEEDVNRV